MKEINFRRKNRNFKLYESEFPPLTFLSYYRVTEGKPVIYTLRVLTLDGANCLSKYLFVLDKWEDISILIPYVIYTMFLTKIEFLFSEKVLLKYLTIKSDLKG